MIIHDGGRSSARSSLDKPLISKSAFPSKNEHAIPSNIAAQEFPSRYVDLPKCRLPSSTPALLEQTSISADVTDRVEAHQDSIKKTPKPPSIMRFWFWELVTLVIAAVLLGVILSILFHADNRPQDDWSLPFNINFSLATLPTKYRALLISISAAALAQFKWIWFWSKRSPALGNPQSNRRGVQATCDTGYCSFTTQYQRLNGQSTHASVGFCADCTELTPLVTVVSNRRGELPNGMAVGGNNIMMIKTNNDVSSIRENRDPASEMRRRFAFANVTYLIRTGTLAPNDTSFGPPPPPPSISPSFAAGSCSLWSCLQYFGADVINEKLFEDKVTAEPMLPDAIDYSGDDDGLSGFLEAPANTLPAEWDMTAVQSRCRVNNSVYDWDELDTPFGRLNRLVNDTKVRLLGNPEGVFSRSNVTVNDPPIPVPVNISTIPGPCVFRMARSFHSTMASFLSEDIFNGTCSRKTTAAGSAVVDCCEKWWLELLCANSTLSSKDFETHVMDFADWVPPNSGLDGWG